MFGTFDPCTARPSVPIMSGMLIFVNCQFCRQRINIDERHQPVRFIEREADDIGPRSFVIIGGDAVLHQCTFGEESPGRAGN